MDGAPVDDPDQPSPQSLHASMAGGAHLREGWDAQGTLLSAMLVFGLPSWWLSERLDQQWVLGAGLVLGMTGALMTIWFRYGVHRS